MSTKTLRKRIALVAVSALSAGLLTTVVATPSANAWGAGSTNQTTAADTLQVATQASTTGTAISPGFVSSTTTSSAAARSVGLLYHNGGIGTTQTATMLNTGTLVLYTGTPGSTNTSFVVDGGTLSNAVNGTGSVNASRTAAIVTSNPGSIWFTPNSGATTATISLFTGTGISTSAYDNGTLSGQIVVTIVSSNTKGGVISVANSYVKASSTATTESASVPASSTDAVTTFANATTGYVAVSLNDGFGDDYTANVLEASATNNAIVSWGTVSNSTSTSSAVTTSANNGELQVAQGPTNKNKPLTTVVTIKADGVVVATKTLVWTGDVAKITITDVLISDLGAATAVSTGKNSAGKYENYRAGAKFKLYDSAGNWIDEPSSYAVTSDSAKYGNIVSAVSVTASSATSETKGLVTWTCTTSSTGGKATQSLYTYNADNQKISADFTAACAGDIDTYKASTDKTTYAPGEVVAVTITGYDISGNLANDRHYMGGGNGGSTSLINTVFSGGFASNTAGQNPLEPSQYDALTNGAITYKYIATQTEGTYNITVTVPVNGSGQGAVVLPITVKSNSASVSNTEVLAAIVKLIASINKQITALQKLITKKK